MNDFKNAYQSAVQDMDMLGMKECHIDASLCMDEGRHRRRMMKRMRRTMTTTFSAMCVIFICGFGTVKAADYIENVIKVNKWGFESADAATMARNEGQGGQLYVAEATVEEAMAEETARLKPASTDEMAAKDAAGGQAVDAGSVAGSQAVSVQLPVEESREVQPVMPENGQESELASAQAGDMASGQSQMQEGANVTQQQTMASAGNGQEEWQLQEDNIEVVQTYPDVVQEAQKPTAASAKAQPQDTATQEIPVKNYGSWDEFKKNENIIFPQPSVSIGKSVKATDITVCGDWAMVRYDVDGKVLWMERTDYSKTQGHASSKVFPSGVCNERTYTTPAGYTYTLIDSVRASENEQLQIHAAITVGSYEAFIDFMGYTEDDAKKIMDSIDLSVYE